MLHLVYSVRYSVVKFTSSFFTITYTLQLLQHSCIRTQNILREFKTQSHCVCVCVRIYIYIYMGVCVCERVIGQFLYMHVWCHRLLLTPPLPSCFCFNSNFLSVGKAARAWCCLCILNLTENPADLAELRNINTKRRNATKFTVLK
jgi:hypothetical protein